MTGALAVVLPTSPIVAAPVTLDFDGAVIATTETNNRLWAIVEGLTASARCHFQQASCDAGEISSVVSEVHDPAYLAFLRECAAMMSPEEARLEPHFTAPGLGPETMISRASLPAALRSAEAALHAADALHRGENRLVFALCRPPGHHAGRSWFGGYCYLNNAAVAFRRLSALTGAVGALLDIDFHYPNGTADVIRDWPGCFFGSIHCDTTKTFPFHQVPNELSANRFVLGLTDSPSESMYLEQVDRMVARAKVYEARFIVASIGFDTVAGDPFGGWMLSPLVFKEVGQIFARAAMPVCFLLEGGYAIDQLAHCSRHFAEGLIERETVNGLFA